MNEQKLRNPTAPGQPEKGSSTKSANADFIGVTVLNKKKHWIAVYLKNTRSGHPFASVHAQPFTNVHLQPFGEERVK